ncbi:MAG: pyridoxal phosphate-dependent aminotransferase family protein [Planctomycetota bacterium]
MDLFDKCRKFERAKALQQSGLYPYFRPIDESNCTRVKIDGHELVMVGSNNYLGLTHDPRVVASAKAAIDEYGSSCTGSRFLNGTINLHEELEQELADFLGFPACVIFSTGFQVNLGVISAIAGKDDIIFCDKENHASILDACRLSLAEVKRFRHNDVEDLDRKLAASDPDAGKLVVVDGVFSMVGQIADVPAIVEVAQRHGARVMVDDAHGVGVLGEEGSGTLEHFGLRGAGHGVDIVGGTFSKSLASLGGFVVASEEVIHYVKHIARSLMFSASCSPPNAAAALTALRILRSEPERLRRLWSNVDRMKTGLDEMGYDTMGSKTPIIPLKVGGEPETFLFAKALYDAGVFVNPVVPPGAPIGLVRTSYMATHADEDLTFALGVFERLASRVATATNS